MTKNIEDLDALKSEMKDSIWQRDGRVCKRCFRVLYRTRRPKGQVHHIDLDKRNNKASNLILLCSGCHNALHYTF